MRLAHLGLSVALPTGWDGRIYRRSDPTPGASTHPVLHAATVPLTGERGDYGGGVVERLGAGDVFLALLEFHADSAGKALFDRPRPESLLPEYFGPNNLQRALPGQGGAQFFFSERGRPFCLYVVLGSYADRGRLVPLAGSVAATLEVS